MENIFNGKRVLFVIDKDYYPLIFQYKNNHPEFNIKVITSNELIDKVGYRFSKDPLPYLIKEKKIEYIKAKKLTNLIRYLSASEENVLTKYIDELKEYLVIDEYGLYEISQYDIYLLEMDEDRGIRTLLDTHSIKYHLLHLDDLDIPVSETFKSPKIIYFTNKFAQFSYIFSKIRQRLIIEDGGLNHSATLLQHRLSLLISDESDLYFISILSKLFGLEFYIIFKTPLISIPSVSRLLEHFYKNKKIEVTNGDDKDDYIINTFDLIKQYGLDDDALDFDFAYSNLVEVLTEQKVQIINNDKGIVAHDNFLMNPLDETYITNFQFGSFYKEYEDNNYLSDSQLEELGLTTSYDKTSLDERKKFNYLRYMNTPLLSRVKQHLSDQIYDSHFINYFKEKGVKISQKAIDFDEFNNSLACSKEGRRLLNAHRLDQLYYRDTIKNTYKNYDHRYKGVNANEIMIPKEWAVTRLESFYNCPFKYLMDKLFKLPSDLSHMLRGQLIHKVFESILHDDFDFDIAFNDGVETYKKEMLKNHIEFGDKEEIWIELIRHYLKNICKALLQAKEKMNIVVERDDHERRIYYDIGPYHFIGFIDKIAYTEYNNEPYYTIIDYKSGHESFEPEGLAGGKSIQLPLYYYAINSQKDVLDFTKGGKFGGFVIQHTYFSTIKGMFGDGKGRLSISELLKATKYAGISLSSEEYWRSFDQTSILVDENEETGEVVEGFDTKKALLLDGKYQYSSIDDDSILINKDYGLNRYNVNDMINTSKNVVLRIIDDIINNRFDIAPTNTTIHKPIDLNNLNCKYCNHSRVCYVNKITDARDFSKLIKEILHKEVD